MRNKMVLPLVLLACSSLVGCKKSFLHHDSCGCGCGGEPIMTAAAAPMVVPTTQTIVPSAPIVYPASNMALEPAPVAKSTAPTK